MMHAMLTLLTGILTGILRKNIRVAAGFIFLRGRLKGPGFFSLRLQVFKTSDTVETGEEIS
jgi:hypothetical protein